MVNYDDTLYNFTFTFLVSIWIFLGYEENVIPFPRIALNRGRTPCEEFGLFTSHEQLL